MSSTQPALTIINCKLVTVKEGYVNELRRHLQKKSFFPTILIDCSQADNDAAAAVRFNST